MADEKLNTGPGEEKLPEAPAPVTVDEPQAPAPEQTAAPTPQQEGPAQPEPGDVVVSFDKINELMNEKRQTARAEVEKEEAAKEPEEKTQEEPPAVGDNIYDLMLDENGKSNLKAIVAQCLASILRWNILSEILFLVKRRKARKIFYLINLEDER